jgi:hypothetical protein
MRRTAPAERQGDCPRECREQQAFGQQLVDETPPVGTQRRADCQLRLARDRAREQEVRHADAGDQENGNHRPGEERHGRPHIADQVLAERQNGDPRTTVRPRLFRLDLRGDCVHFGARVLERPPLREAAHHVPIATSPAPDSWSSIAFGVHKPRCPDPDSNRSAWNSSGAMPTTV